MATGSKRDDDRPRIRREASDSVTEDSGRGTWLRVARLYLRSADPCSALRISRPKSSC
jgi:hypothetical protein